MTNIELPFAPPTQIEEIRTQALAEALRLYTGHDVGEERIVNAAIVFEHYLRTGELVEKNYSG